MSLPQPLASAPPTPPTPPAPVRRRRLWELPPEAHELLLGLGFDGDQLRQEAQRVLGRLHRVSCELLGSPSDVLYSVVHDMAWRNPLSERLQQLLQQRFATAESAVRGLRDEDTLRAVWHERLQDGAGERIVAAFWALLTHPMGTALQPRLLFDLKTRCWQHARHTATQTNVQRALQATVDGLQQQLRSQQARAAEAAQRHEAERQAWAQQQAQWQGERARLTALASATAPGPAPIEAAPRRDTVLAAPPTSTGPRRERWQRPPMQADTTATPEADKAAVVDSENPGAITPDAQPAADPPATAPGGHRRVLCVGGVQHAVPRYREHVERLGARFEHHDGGLEDSLPRLEGHLSRADLVVCQAGCINHEAYHRIKRHCARTGTPCVYLERPSLSRFEAAIGLHLRTAATIAGSSRHG